jgi:tetratricopeptide (TPR) repeat protein
VGDPNTSFHDMVEILGLSKAPLSVRVDVAYKPTSDELQIARRAIGHIMADAQVRGRIASLKVEPLVRASSIVLEDAKAGKAAKSQREIAESIAEYLDVLDRAFGALPSVLNNRGLARSILSDFPGASADFSAARQLAPTFVAPRVNEIALLRRKGDFAHLERVAHEIERADPGDVEALRALLDAKVALKRPTADVLPLARSLFDAKGARPSDLLLLGSLAEGAGHPEEAEGYLRAWVEANPKEPEGHLRLAAVLLEQGKPAEALEIYEKLTEVDGPKHEYLLAIALVYDQMDRLDDAANAFDFALEHASARDQEIIERAFDEFKQRRGKDEAAPSTVAAEQPLPQPFAVEEADLREPPAADGGPAGPPPAALAPDFGGDEFAPMAVGEAELLGLSGRELPVDGSAAPPMPSPAEVPKPPPVAPEPPFIPESAPAAPHPPPAPKAPEAPSDTEEERIVRALEGDDGEAGWADDIMGGSDEAAPAAARPAHEEPPKAEPSSPPEAPRVPEESPLEQEAIVVARTEAIVVRPEPLALPTAPVVTGPAPAPTAARAEPAAHRAGPVVSAPPPAGPAEAPDEELTAALEALSEAATSAATEPPSEPEPFRRPTFDVDAFMAALEAKAKPVFDHLYDGMLEARRKDGADRMIEGPPSGSLYESAPPSEMPSIETRPSAAPVGPGSATEVPPSAAKPPTVEAPPPAMPALFHEPAKKAIVEAAGEARPHDPSLLPKAEELARRGDDKAALEAVDAFLAGRSDDARAWNLQGDLRERAGDERGAVDSYWKAVKYDPALREAWNNLGVLLHLTGRLDEALGAFESAVKASPDDRHLWHNLGSTYHELGRLNDALTAFNRAIQIDPADKVSYNNRGTTLFELGDFVGARASFERAAQIDPHFEQAFNNLGRALEKLDDREGAVKSFEAALAQNARSRTALKNLARVLRELGRGNEATAAESRLAALPSS